MGARKEKIFTKENYEMMSDWWGPIGSRLGHKKWNERDESMNDNNSRLSFGE